MTRQLIFSFFLLVISILCLSATFIFTFLLEQQFDSINFSSYCPKQYLYAKEENVVTQEEIQFIRNCFCERLNILQLAFGWQQKYQDRCEEYIGKVNNYYYSLPSYGLCVSIVNWALKMTVKNGSRWLKFRDITSEAKFQMTFLYVL